MRHSTLFALGCLLAGGSALGHWSPGDPAKYVQKPDLVAGMDVNATYTGQYPYVKVLADDWLCTSAGPVADIHVWGSWLNDQLPRTVTGLPDPNLVVFKLSIHEDIRSSTSYSRPGAVLWETIVQPGAFTVRNYANANEQFYDPNTNQILGSDTTVWQYNFDNFATPFIQLGTAANPKVYWLDVQARPVGDVTSFTPVFGWKTSRDSYAPNVFGLSDDDAVFGDTTSFGGVPAGWTDMHYPLTSAYAQQSINLAFVITPEPTTALLLMSVVPLALRRR